MTAKRVTKKKASSSSSKKEGGAKKTPNKKVSSKVAKTTTSKKATKKASTKKVAGAKKKITTRDAKHAKSVKTVRRVRVYRDLEPHEHFWVHEGEALTDLLALADALRQMSDEQYAYHAFERGDNDFANWVFNVFEEPILAQRIRGAKSRQGAYRVVTAHVSLYC